MISNIKRKPVSGSITYSKVAQAAHSLSGDLRSPSDDQRLSSPLSDDRYSITQDQRPVSPVSANSFSSNLETPSSIYLHNNTNLEAHLIRLPAFEHPRLLELTDPRGPGQTSSETRQEKGRKYVKWGIHWSQPSYVLLLTVSAIALALGHHFYYNSLNGTSVGSVTRQQWSITFGSSFAYLVVHFLGAAIVAAYSQYIWSIVRQRSYTLEALDNLFAMTSDPRAFFNWEVLKHGRFAVLLALMTWLMGFASVTPPATLSVVSGFQNETNPTPWPLLDWSLPNWVHDQYYFTPAESVLDMATSSANQMQILSMPPPAPNSTYQMNFYGPSVQCNAANATQQPIFDYYMQALANQSFNATEMIHTVIVTQAVVESPDFNETYQSSLPVPSLEPLILSAFSPTERTWYAIEEEVESSGIDQYNNWPVDLPPGWKDTVQFWISADNDNGTGPEFSWTTQQLWLQTASQGIVCILGNASYEVGFEYVDGVQSVSQNINDFEPLFMRTYGSESPASYYEPAVESYVAVFTALTSLLSGNITMQLDPIETNNGVPGNISLEISTETSKALLTGLIACDDVAPTYWFDNMWQFETEIEKHEQLDNSSYIPNDLFDKPSWMCRNRTLAPAIEDLFNNITISMLGADISGTTNQTIPVKYFTTHNVYQYNSRNLILSYSIAVGVTLFCIIIGTYATITNGVSHSNSFSAMIATTRNSQLDRLVEGSSLGALPLNRKMRKTRLKFGELLGDGREKGGVTGHIGFGFEDNVLNLRKGGKYT